MTHKSARSRVEEVHESPPHAGGSGPAGPGFCGRRLPLQRRRRGQLRARSVASKGSANSAGLLSPAELAELQQPRDALGLGQDARSSKEMRVYRVNSPPLAIFARRTCRPRSGRSCKRGAAEGGDFSLIGCELAKKKGRSP